MELECHLLGLADERTALKVERLYDLTSVPLYSREQIEITFERFSTRVICSIK